MKKQIISGVAGLTLVAAFQIPYAAHANPAQAWTNVNAYELQESDGSLFNSENYAFLKYSQLGNTLNNMAKQSNRVTVEVTGQSANGHNLYTVTISNPSDKGKLGANQAIRKQMFNNPDNAQAFVDKHPDFKVPVFINASIHGTEFTGTDAALQLIQRFAFDNDEVTQSILANTILIFNVNANPDGRVDATRFNGNGIDINRDFITQSQPETRQTVSLLTKWNPMVMLDLHGYVKGYTPGSMGLIEPCTPPHNPNYEYDLYSKWAMDQAKAMEAEIMADKSSFTKGTTAALYEKMVGTYIPQRDDSAGWDDYPPIFTPMYAMYHGAFGATLETPTNDENGVRWQYDAVLGALKFAAANKGDMMKDQIEMFKRGINFDHPYHETGYFPEAYILPVDEQDPTVTNKAVQHLLNNDIDVQQAKQAFTADGKTYPAGTYLVNMHQAKAGLANTMLWDGEDITDDTPAMYDISAWSLPQLWGFQAIPTQSAPRVQAVEIHGVQEQGALIGKGPYLIPNSSVQAVRLANELLASGYAVSRDAQGNFYTTAKGAEIGNLVKSSGLTLKTADVPSDAQALTYEKIAILKDGGMGKQQSHSGTRLALQRLGFQVTELTPQQVAEQGLSGYDAFVYSGVENLISYANSVANREFGLQNASQFQSFKSNITSFVNGGGQYLAVGAGASQATKNLGLTSVTVIRGGSNSNGIVKVNYLPSPLTVGYGADDLGFVYRPAWYTNTGNTTVAATLANTSDFFLSGHWANRSAAQGQPVIVTENGKNVTLIGLEAGFRDHTDYLFRLLSNVIYQ